MGYRATSRQPPWKSSDVKGQNSGGIAYQTAGGSVVNGTGGSWYDWAGTFAAGCLTDFTHSAGVLTYTGAETRVFKANFNGVFRATGTGTPAWISVGVSVNNATPATCTHRVMKGTSTATGASMSSLITLSQGDTVRMKSLAVATAEGSTTVYWDMICALTVSV